MGSLGSIVGRTLSCNRLAFGGNHSRVRRFRVVNNRMKEQSDMEVAVLPLMSPLLFIDSALLSVANQPGARLQGQGVSTMGLVTHYTRLWGCRAAWIGDKERVYVLFCHVVPCGAWTLGRCMPAGKPIAKWHNRAAACVS